MKSRHAFSMESTEAPLPMPDAHAVSVVYYIQWADRIKIGTSRNLPGRLASFTYDRLVAIEPGAHAREHMRHLEFAPYRLRGEWFLASDELLGHVERLRRHFGDPREAYVRWLLGGAPAEMLDKPRGTGKLESLK